MAPARGDDDGRTGGGARRGQIDRQIGIVDVVDDRRVSQMDADHLLFVLAGFRARSAIGPEGNDGVVIGGKSREGGEQRQHEQAAEGRGHFHGE